MSLSPFRLLDVTTFSVKDVCNTYVGKPPKPPIQKCMLHRWMMHRLDSWSTKRPRVSYTSSLFAGSLLADKPPHLHPCLHECACIHIQCTIQSVMNDIDTLLQYFRSKNTVNILIKNWLDMCIGALVYWAVGFGFTFGHSLHHFMGASYFLFYGMPSK